MHALIFAVADDVALRLRARDHLLHVAAAHVLQRLAGQHMDMPGLGVHRRRRAFGDLQDFLDHRPRHGLVLETAHALAGLDQRLEFHCLAPVSLQSWPDLFRPSTFLLALITKTWMAGSSPAMTAEGGLRFVWRNGVTSFLLLLPRS